MKYLSIHFSGRYSRLLHRDNSSIIDFFSVDPSVSLYLKLSEVIPDLLQKTSFSLIERVQSSRSGVLNFIKFICRFKYMLYVFRDYRVSINLNLNMIYVNAAENCLQTISLYL